MSSHLMNGHSRHQCMIYDGDPVNQLPVFAEIVKEKLHEGFRCMYFNSPFMLLEFTTALKAIGVDVSKEVSESRIILSSDTPATDDDFDIDGMLLGLEDSLNLALSEGCTGLFATGDMTWEFKTDRNFSRLMEIRIPAREILPASPGVFRHLPVSQRYSYTRSLPAGDPQSPGVLRE